MPIRARLAVLLAVLTPACATDAPDGPAVLRLVDLFPAATVEGGVSAGEAFPRTEWLFDAEASADGSSWQAAAGVAGLAVDGGALAGRSSTDFPLLYAERTSEVPESAVLHAVEVRARISAGAELGVSFDDEEEFDPGPVLGSPFPWRTASPVVAGDEAQLYTLRPTSTVTAGDIRWVLLRPSDIEGAEFAVESIRLVFRKEHLASVPAGVGWHGMEEIYKESLASRAGETMRFEVELPARPRLDLGLATLDGWPATFRVTVDAGDGERPVLERTITSPDRWHEARADLSELGGRTVSLALSIASEQPAAVGLWGAPAIRSAPAAPATGPRGVVLVIGDTLRADHLDLYGYGRETAPNLTRLAGEGAFAQTCISQGTWTKVSVPSILTSLYPSTHGVQSFTARLPASAETLAEVFRAAGWATVGFSSISFNGRFTNLHQGYEEFHESGSLHESRNSKTAREYSERFLDWLERHHDTPFFAVFHVADPHSPYFAYSPYDTLWGEPGDADEYRRQQDASRPHIESGIMRRFGMPRRSELVAAGLDPETYVGFEHDAYDGSIRAMDVEIGRVLEGLRGLGLEDETLVAFTSDHGTEFLDHDRHFHGHSVYGELHRVPLLLRGPGVTPGTRIERVVQSIDLMPTILELAGVAAPEGVQGQSLVPLLGAGGGTGWRERPAFTEKVPQSIRGGEGADTESYAIVAEGWKLIHNVSGPEGLAEFELYDVVSDPLDTTDVAADHPEVVTRLAGQIAAFREQAASQRLASDAELSEGMSAEELERLRSLGYL